MAATVVERERLQAPGLSVVGALRGTPGLVAAELGGAGAPASVSLRGATPAQTPVYFAGVRLNDEVGGTVDLGSIPLWFVERIEVYRGNAPIEADRLGLGGAIFIEPRLPEGEKLEVGVLAGSHGTVGIWTLGSAGDAADGIIAGVGLGRAQNDYSFLNRGGTHFDPGDDRPSRRHNIDAEWADAWLHARRRLGPLQLAWVAHHGRLERGAQSNAAVPVEQARQDATRDLAQLATRLPLSRGGEWLEARSSVLLTRSETRDAARELGLGATRVTLADARLDHALGVRLTPHPKLVLRPLLSLGIERMQRHEVRDELVLSEPVLVAHRLDLRPLVSADLAIGRTALVLRAVAALECESAGPTALELCASAHPTGRVGPTWLAGPLVLYANVGRYLRSPTLGQRFGISPLLRGNPRLTPERGLSLEVGMRYDQDVSVPFWLDAVGFARFAEDLIEYVPVQGHRVPMNRDRGRFLGLELASGISPLAGVRLDLALTLLDARDLSASRAVKNNVLTLQPRFSVAPAISLERHLDATAVERVGVVARYTYQSSRYDDPAGLTVLPEQGGLEFQLQATWLEGHITSRLRVDNAFDQRRVDVLGFPLPGRSFYAAVELHH